MSVMQTHCKLTKPQNFAIVCLTARNHCFTVYCVVCYLRECILLLKLQNSVIKSCLKYVTLNALNVLHS